VCHADGPLYTLQAGDTGYETVPSESSGSVTWTPLQTGVGYWVYFDQPTDVYLPGVPRFGPSLALPIEAGKYIMIGGEFPSGATVSGADAVYVYEPSRGYVQYTGALHIGQGALAYSNSGGSVTLSPPQ